MSEVIQNLPPELREKIYKEYVSLKIKEKQDLGYDMVHFNIENAPFCEENQQITRPMGCLNWETMEMGDMCWLCFKKEKNHFLCGSEHFNLFEDDKLIFLLPYFPKRSSKVV